MVAFGKTLGRNKPQRTKQERQDVGAEPDRTLGRGVTRVQRHKCGVQPAEASGSQENWRKGHSSGSRARKRGPNWPGWAAEDSRAELQGISVCAQEGDQRWGRHPHSHAPSLASESCLINTHHSLHLPPPGPLKVSAPQDYRDSVYYSVILRIEDGELQTSHALSILRTDNMTDL